MQIFGLAGWSGSGKTTMLTRLLPAIIARGVTVSTIKHAHHDFDVDQPGKDSYRHRQAGANEVLISSVHRWALMHELRGAHEPTLQELLAHLSPVDVVLVEGFKRDPLDKLEVYRASVGKPLLAADDPHIVAVASDAPIGGLKLPRLDIDDTDAIAAFILRHCGLDRDRGRRP
jgi:molybdopterin-guanine dinucleotide biosynthesis protein B